MLPFLQAPAAPRKRVVGNNESGTLELPVLGGLTVGESAVIADLLAGEQSSFVKGAQIADAIAKEEHITLLEAFQLIENAIGGKELEPAAETMRLKHAARIEEVARIYTASGQRNMEASVTALVRCRLQLPDWSLEDTRGLHRRLFNDIYDVLLDEQAAENDTAAPPTEEELGKPPAEPGAAKPSTGKKSSGT
jgi:hypothetical protein